MSVLVLSGAAGAATSVLLSPAISATFNADQGTHDAVVSVAGAAAEVPHMDSAIVGLFAAVLTQRMNSKPAAAAAAAIAAMPSSTLDEDLAYFISRRGAGDTGEEVDQDAMAESSGQGGDSGAQIMPLSTSAPPSSRPDLTLTLGALGSTLLALLARDQEWVGLQSLLSGDYSGATAGMAVGLASLATGALTGE